MNNKLWNDLIKNGKKNQSHKLTNVLNSDDVTVILATMDFFGADATDLQQTKFDLTLPRYRVFDWLAMGLGDRIRNKTALKVLIHAFITASYNEKKFIDMLRVCDYQIDTEWERVEID